MIALAPLDLSVGVSPLVFLLAKLGIKRLRLLLRARFERTKISRRLRFDFSDALEKPLLEHREATIVILHLIAEQQIADFVHAYYIGIRKWTIADLPGRFGWDRLNFSGILRFHLQVSLV